MRSIKRNLNLPTIVGIVLLLIGAFYVGGSYLMTMFPDYPCIQFWCYTTEYEGRMGAYTLPNGTRVEGHGISNVKIEMTCPECTDTPPIIHTGQQSWTSYTDKYGLTWFQFGFDVQVDKTWTWKATFPTGETYEGNIYLPPRGQGLDAYVFIEKSRGLTHVYPSWMWVPKLGEETTSVKIYINGEEVEPSEQIILKSGEISLKIVPLESWKVRTVGVYLNGESISMRSTFTATKCWFETDLDLPDGEYVLSVHVNEVRLASIGLQIESGWIDRNIVCLVLIAAGAVCVVMGVRKR